MRNEEKKPNKPPTLKTKERFFEHYIIPLWCDTDFRTIAYDELHEFFEDYQQTPGIAGNLFSVLRTFYNWTVIKQRWVQSNPMADMESPYNYVPRDRTLSDDEIRWYWRACDALGFPFGDWGKMLLLSVQRRTEVKNIAWAEIDRDYVWHLLATQTKSRRPNLVFFSRLAQEVLTTTPHVGDAGLIFTIPGIGWDFTAIKNRIKRLMREFCRRETGLDYSGTLDAQSWVFHDVRRTGATIMARLGYPKDIVHKILNHSDGRGDGRNGILDRVYIIHEYYEERRQALEGLGEYVRKVISERNVS